MGGIAYGASKAAVMHICKVLAVELSGQGVMVNAIAPGPIETGISKHGPSRKQGYLDRIPTHSYGNVDAVANAALYLASDECDWVTGHVLNVDVVTALPDFRMIPPRLVDDPPRGRYRRLSLCSNRPMQQTRERFRYSQGIEYGVGVD